METTIDGQMLVRDLVVRFPQARPVLETLGVDYCCGGTHPLAEAAKAAGVELATVLAALDQALHEPAPVAETASPDWAETRLTVLADHIQATHHAYLKRELPHLELLFAKVIRAHGAKHGAMLQQLHGVFTALRAELEPHLMKEEHVLFPSIAKMEEQVAATGTVPPLPCGTIRNPIRQLEKEHENAGQALANLRRISGDYTLPADACPTFTALYQLLAQMEDDLHLHIHLENNILFPRAIALETLSDGSSAKIMDCSCPESETERKTTRRNDMNEPVFTAREVLQYAIKNEQTGEAFYRRIAETTADSAVREVFLLLCQEELRHAGIFKKMLAETVESATVKAAPGEYAGYLIAYYMADILFAANLADELPAAPETMAVLDFGIRRELDSVTYYMQARDLVPAGQAKLIDKIVEEERDHFLKLSALKRKYQIKGGSATGTGPTTPGSADGGSRR